MNFMHPPTALSLAIGCGLTMFDLWLFQRRACLAMLEDLARMRFGSRRVLDCLEEAHLVEVSRDAFGDVLTLTWRADPSTVLLTAAQLVLERHARAGGPPLPNKRLKLSGGDRSKGNGVVCAGAHKLSFKDAAPGRRVARRLSAIRRPFELLPSMQ